MNRPPEILVNSGFVTDANGVLTEMVIPNNVITQKAPSIVTTYATTINWIPSNTSTLTQFNALKLQEINSGLLKGYTNLTTVNMPMLTAVSCNGDNAPFGGCTALTTVNMPMLQSATFTSSNHGMFRNCTSLVSITLPSFSTIGNSGANLTGGFFAGCGALATVNLPVIQTINDPGNSYCATFLGCSSLSNVILGSEGHPVSRLSSGIFYGCTQSGLTITVYTSGGAALSGEPWGATNATIEYEEA